MTKMEKQLADVGKAVGGTIDQLDLDKRLSAVEKTLVEAADKAGLTDRRKVLGVPVSRKRPAWGKIAAIGAATVGALAAGARLLGSDDGGDGLPEKHSAKDWKQDDQADG